MSNIEGASKTAADVGIARGPKGQAADHLAELRALRNTKGKSDGLNKLFDSVEFLLDQFSK